MLETPVLLIVFNRPDTTRQVFARIRETKPKKLFIAADGPRLNKTGEGQKCEQVRKTVLAGIDWKCEVFTLFQEKNLGCGQGPAAAITWFFKNVEEGIILEDDCVPSLSFFSFCESLLTYYRNDPKIMHISGNNFQFGKKRGKGSYYFSKYTHNWGWASWRRAWSNYDFEIANYEDYLESEDFEQKAGKRQEQIYWLKMFESLRKDYADVWDVQWLLTVWRCNGLAILPNVNLVQNIGVGNHATHTLYMDERILFNQSVEIQYKLTHPEEQKVNVKADNHTFNVLFHAKTTLANRVRNIAYKIVPRKHYQRLKTFKNTFSEWVR